MSITKRPKSRFALAMEALRWVCVAVILGVVTVRYIVPMIEEQTAVAPEETTEEGLPALPTPDYLPADTFIEPNAKALAGISRKLIDDPYDRRVPMRDLRSFISQPERYFGDLQTYLVLRTAYWQLRRDPDPKGSVEVADMIWALAQDIDSYTRIRSAQADRSE
ncbi:MAG: DUF4175 family protein [Alphaproteobacteria bacterium]|nr:DUF4175 family protein [Alphaproteobacteria bacterium]